MAGVCRLILIKDAERELKGFLFLLSLCFEGRREPGIEWEHCEVPALFFWNGITDPDEHDAAMEESIEMLRAAEAQQANQRPIQRRKRRRTDLIRPAVPGTTCRRRRDSDST